VESEVTWAWDFETAGEMSVVAGFKLTL
jgi:hypothetical protein